MPRKIKEAERAKPPLKSAQELNRGEPASDSTALEGLLTPKEAAQFFASANRGLAKARMRGDGPPYMMFGRSIRYGEGALVRWTKSCVRQSTSER